MGKEKNKKTIDKTNLILCEGEDATQFLIRYISMLQKTETAFSDFLVLDFGGNDELSTFLFDLPSYPGYDIVKTIIIVRDAERNHEDAVKSVKSALEKSAFPVPLAPNMVEKNEKVRLAFSLFPSLSTTSRNGTLEDLFIENLAESGVEVVISEIRSFLDDLQAKGRKLTWFHKSMLHTYFSVTDGFVSKKIGQATEAGAFNFDCDEMNLLRDLMTRIIQE